MAEYKAFSPTAWKAFMKQFPEKAGLVVTSLPTATEAMTNLVRFSLETNQWYVCDGTQWVSATPVIPEPDLSAYKKQFNGTLAEWNALSEDEQAGYDSAAIDDVAGAGSMLTGTVEEGNENAVTSDAVAKAISGFASASDVAALKTTVANKINGFVGTLAQNKTATVTMGARYSGASMCIQVQGTGARRFTIEHNDVSTTAIIARGGTEYPSTGSATTIMTGITLTRTASTQFQIKNTNTETERFSIWGDITSVTVA